MNLFYGVDLPLLSRVGLVAWAVQELALVCQDRERTQGCVLLAMSQGAAQDCKTDE